MTSMAEAATGILDGKDAMEQMLTEVQREYPDLTRGGLNNPPSEGSFADAEEEIVAAVKYMALCQESKNGEAYSYGMKHRAENWAGRYIANGSMIAAALMVGANIRRESPRSPNAYILVDEPRKCWRNDSCGGLIPAASPDRICHDCKRVDAEDPQKDHVAILAREGFWVWVGDRKAGDNARGDFIRDTRDFLSTDADPDIRLYDAVRGAQQEHDVLWRRYAREQGLPEETVTTFLQVELEEDY